MPLDRHAERLLAMLAASRSAGAAAVRQDVVARRAALDDLAVLAADPPPPDVTVTDMTCPGLDGPLLVRRFTPAGAADAALLYLHGGGWTAGGLQTHAGVCGALAKASAAAVFALNYRLAPEHPFPAALEDACAAWAWLGGRSDELGLNPSRLGLAGDSAGANIAAAAAGRLAGLGGTQPVLQLLLCPILAPSRQNGSRAEFRQGFFIEAETLAQDLDDYLAGAPTDDPRVAPLRAKDLSGLPPTLVHAAEYDPFRDEALDYVARLRLAGVEAQAYVHPGMIHYFYALPRAIPTARAVIAEIGAEVGARLSC